MASAAIPQPVADTPVHGSAAPSWSLAHRILFRFACSYFVLYALPDSGRVSIINTIPGAGFLTSKYVSIWHALCPWVAIHIFHLSGKPTTYFPTGSGDTTLDYIQNLLFVAFALTATLVWSLADYKRREYRLLDAWLRVLVRYTLAFTLLSYGFAKVFPLQFRPPGFGKLIEPYGDFSPMGVLWSFMGASIPYIMFSGACEVLGGLLLFFRRTATLGALVSLMVLLNVAVLNFCYDVPVKLYSSNLVLMCVFLAGRDLRRLYNFFLFNRPTVCADLSAPRFERRWLRLAALTFQILFVGFYLFTEIKSGWSGYKARYINPALPPIYGLYEVETFTRNGQPLPPLVTDSTRWRRLIVQVPAGLTVKMMDDSTQSFATEYDAAKKTVTLTAGNDKDRKFPLSYSLPDSDHLLLEGSVFKEPVAIRLRRVDASKFLLASRGFHWINELPFNR